jgi:hypothetical protein
MPTGSPADEKTIWDRRCRALQREYHGGPPGDNDVDLESNELGKALRPVLCPAIFDRDIVAIGPAEFVQPLQKGGNPSSRRRGRAQKPDGREPRRLLGVRGERQCRRASSK